MRVLFTSDVHFGFDCTTAGILARAVAGLRREHGQDLADVLVLAGDIGSDRLRHFVAGLRFFRREFPDTPILTVDGNHDWWDRGIKNPAYGHQKRLGTARELGVHCLGDDGPWIRGEVEFLGYDGWYAPGAGARANDWLNIRRELPDGTRTREWLERREREQIERIRAHVERPLQGPRPRRALVTHFPCSPGCSRYWCERPVAYAMENASPGPHDGSFDAFEPVFQPHFDYLLFGHTHIGHDCLYRGVRHINAGSDYLKPQFRILNVEEADADRS